MYTAELFKTLHCPRCLVTNTQLSKVMKTTLFEISREKQERMDVINYMDKHGYKSAPLVRIYKNGIMCDEWAGLQPNKIKHWQLQAKYE